MPSLPSLHTSHASFVNIRLTQGLYVDKTHHFATLLPLGHNATGPEELATWHLLTRPRRFGKTLLVSTLEAWFQGHLPVVRPRAGADAVPDDLTRKLRQQHPVPELFQGTAILARQPQPIFHPVLLLDMSWVQGDTASALQQSLLQLVTRAYTTWHRRGLDTGEDPNRNHRIDLPWEAGGDAPSYLEALIETLWLRYDARPVILIDEYDAPITRLMGHPSTQTEPLMDVLRGFFRVLKSTEKSLHYVFLTGITRFAHTNLFAALNNLIDISWDPRYADLCGFTRAEVARDFAPHLAQIQQDWPTAQDDLADRICDQYNGYRFGAAAHTRHVCNPFTLTACINDLLTRPDIRPVQIGDWPRHWAYSGTPEFLTELIRRQGSVLPHAQELNEFPPAPIYDLHNPDAAMLMLQTGYSTLRGQPGQLWLDYPNHEVRHTYALSLLRAFRVPYSSHLMELLYQSLRAGDHREFIFHLTSCYASIPYDYLDSEHSYTIVLQTLCLLLNTEVQAERHNWSGRSDLTVFLPECIYVFALKYNGSLLRAERQVHRRHYGREHASRGVDLYACYLNFKRDVTRQEPPVIESKVQKLDFPPEPG